MVSGSRELIAISKASVDAVQTGKRQLATWPRACTPASVRPLPVTVTCWPVALWIAFCSVPWMVF